MEMEDILKICSVNDHINNNVFVGIKFDDHKISVHFPLGFRLENSRKDIQLLISILKRYSYNSDRDEYLTNQVKKNTEFPLQAYQYIIVDYINRGYYYERETNYKKSQKGNVNWKKTIKNVNPVVYNGRLGYLDFWVKNIDYTKETEITLIHEYCVYESIKWMGWLYNLPLPQKPKLELNKKLFLSRIDEKMKCTFSDSTKELLLAMKAVLLSLDDDGQVIHKACFGTERFEYIWEKMVDQVYGIKEKKNYFPNTFWNVKGKTKKYNSPLEPDTIMLKDNDVFILDAKYYKYGVSNRTIHLPETSSISKQITYGEFVEENNLCDGEIYNCFIMPYDCQAGIFPSDNEMFIVGVACSDWKSSQKKYENVVGLLVDTKNLMKHIQKDSDKINRLAYAIKDEIG